MTEHMEQDSPLQIISDELGQCGDHLEKLAKTCCLKERSNSMRELMKALDGLNGRMMGQVEDQDAIDSTIEEVIEFGGKAGALHVSCCTRTREAFYQKLLKSLNQIHTQLWALKGASH